MVSPELFRMPRRRENQRTSSLESGAATRDVGRNRRQRLALHPGHVRICQYVRRVCQTWSYTASVKTRQDDTWQGNFRLLGTKAMRCLSLSITVTRDSRLWKGSNLKRQGSWVRQELLRTTRRRESADQGS